MRDEIIQLNNEELIKVNGGEVFYYAGYAIGWFIGWGVSQPITPPPSSMGPDTVWGNVFYNDNSTSSIKITVK